MDLDLNTESKRVMKKVKKPEVPIHKAQKNLSTDNIPTHKTFSANFSSNNKSKSDHKIRFHELNKGRGDESLDVPKIKVSRRLLQKENDKISGDNLKLLEELKNVEHAVSKKELVITKLKEKIKGIQHFNKEILNENSIIKTQYQDLLVCVEEYKTKIKNKKCSSCENLQTIIEENNNELKSLKSMNQTLIQDLEMLKNVVYRLNVQLERYQNKLRKVARNQTTTPSPENQHSMEIIAETCSHLPENIEEHSNHLHNPISWGNVNSHTLGPLLDAYQDTVQEKEEIIKIYEAEMANFTSKLKSIVDENHRLHIKATEDEHILKKNLKELEYVKRELKVARDQNEILVKKCSVKHDKLQEIVKVYDHKVEVMHRDYEILQDQYHKARAEVSILHDKYQNLVDQHEILKNDRASQIPLTIHTASVNECKRLFEELKAQYDCEKTKMANQIKVLESQIPPLEKQVIDLGAEKRELQMKLKANDKQILKIETRLLETSKSLKQTQLSRDLCRKQLNKAIQFGRELVTEQESLLQQLSTRKKENKAAIQLSTSISTKMETLKSQLKTVQKDAFDELASVEKRIIDQDNSLELMKVEYEAQIMKLTNDVKERDEILDKIIEHYNIPPTPYLLFREKN